MDKRNERDALDEGRWKNMIALLVIASLLAAAITFRFISLRDIDTAVENTKRWEEMVGANENAPYFDGERFLGNVMQDYLDRDGKLPAPNRVQETMANAMEAEAIREGIEDDRSRFLTMIDVIIWILVGMIAVTLGIGLLRRMKS